MLATGLVASVHCVAMCGALVLTYTVKDASEGSWLERTATHGAYHTAKIVSYVLVGVVLGYIGSAFDLTGVRGWVTVAAGLFMVLLGLSMTGRFPALKHITPRPPRLLIQAIASRRTRAKEESSLDGMHVVTPFVLGLLTGLMPCGPLQAAQLYAAGTGSAARGAIAMLGFGLGTMPLMLAFGTVSGMLTGAFKQRMIWVSAAVVLLLGVVMLNRGALLVGSPVTLQSVQAAVLGTGEVAGDVEDVSRGADGVAEVGLSIQNTRFVPNTLVLPEGEPVRLVVDRQEDTGCSDQLAVPALGVLVDLTPNGITTIDLPAARGGAYTLACGMGMMSGRLLIGAAAAQGGAPSIPAIGAIVAAMGAGGWFALRRRRTGPPGGPRAPARSSADGPRAGATVLGFTPTEVMVVLALVAAAAITGLLFGGGLTY
jgi:sulfite exporter TauE/SafE